MILKETLWIPYGLARIGLVRALDSITSAWCYFIGISSFEDDKRAEIDIVDNGTKIDPLPWIKHLAPGANIITQYRPYGNCEDLDMVTLGIIASLVLSNQRVTEEEINQGLRIKRMIEDTGGVSMEKAEELRGG